MAMETLEAAETEQNSEQYMTVSPFSETFQLQPERNGGQAEIPAGTTALESPFRSEYAQEIGSTGESVEREAYQSLVAGLYEAEFSEAVYEVAAEASAAYAQEYGEAEVPTPGEAEQYLERYMAPLQTELETLFERLGEQYAQHDISTLTEAEVDRLFEAMQPSTSHLSPAFENLFGSIWKKVKSAASGVVSLAKRGIAAVGKIIPLGWIFDKLKALVRPLLKRVLQFALDRLPPPLRAVGQKLATKLFGETGELEMEVLPEVGEALAHADPDGIQREFDARAASLFFARDEAEREELISEAAMESEQAGEDQSGALDAARTTFVREIASLERGQDPTAQLENFLPAIMGALRIGISIIGRKRVVGFLAKYLAQLVGPYVGKELASPLSSAIVSTGMSLVGLEAPAEREQLAGEAVANAVEGTVRRLAEQGEQVFEDQRLLEAAMQEAFAEAAAESFPPEMIREQFHEASARSSLRGTWVLRPAKGRRRYKRYTQTIDVTITPQIADAVESFGSITLAQFLRSRYGVAAPVRAKVYLYEAISGTKLSAIVRGESDVPGLGPSAVKGWKMFHPLTRQAAGTLLGEPDLGRDVSAKFVMTRRRIAVGERFFVLVLEGVRPQLAKEVAVGRESQVNLTLDFPRNRVRLFIYLSERDTQTVAASIRRGESATPALLLVRNVYVATLRTMLSGKARRHVKVVHEVAAQEQWFGAALAHVGEAILKRLVDHIVAWVGRALSEYFTRKSQEFITAADRRADGVTLIVTVTHSSVMAVVAKAMRGDAARAGVALTKALAHHAELEVRTVAGFHS